MQNHPSKRLISIFEEYVSFEEHLLPSFSNLNVSFYVAQIQNILRRGHIGFSSTSFYHLDTHSYDLHEREWRKNHIGIFHPKFLSTEPFCDVLYPMLFHKDTKSCPVKLDFLMEEKYNVFCFFRVFLF